MLSVSIDTSTPATQIALGNDTQVVSTLAIQRGAKHVETLVGALEDLLGYSNFSKSEITHICVCVGPGLFSGLRVGVATAKGLAAGLGVQLVRFSSLELLALGYLESQSGAITPPTASPNTIKLVALLDARRGETYAQTFTSIDGELVHSDPARVIANDEVGALIDSIDNPIVVSGFGDLRGLHIGADAGLMTRQLMRDLGQSRNSRLVATKDLTIEYLRASDAEIAYSAKEGEKS